MGTKEEIIKKSFEIAVKNPGFIKSANELAEKRKKVEIGYGEGKWIKPELTFGNCCVITEDGAKYYITNNKGQKNDGIRCKYRNIVKIYEDKDGYKKCQILLIQLVVNDIIKLKSFNGLRILGGKSKKESADIKEIRALSPKEAKWLKEVMTIIAKSGKHGPTDDFFDFNNDELAL